MILLFLFILGTIFGSFGSVLLRRLKDGVSREAIKGILYGRSMCPGCDKILTPGQLIPLLGRLWQRGKCFRCGKSISTMYPILELVSGLVFVMRGEYVMGYGLGVTGFLLLMIWWLLGLLLVWDMMTYQLHLSVFGILVICVLGLRVTGYRLGVEGYGLQVMEYGLVFFLVFLGIYYFGRRYSKIRFGVAQETFGFGDVLMAPVIGMLIGMGVTGYGLGVTDGGVLMSVLCFVLGSCVIGLLYYACLVGYYSLSKKDISDTFHETGSPMIPFLPAMIVWYWIVVMMGG